MRNIANVLPFLSQADTERLIHAFITSSLDYCNVLLSGLPKKAIGQLKKIQNAAAQVLTKTRQRAHITPVLRFLTWLPVSCRIFRLFYWFLNQSTIVHPNTCQICFLSYVPSRSLRSSGTDLLTIPKPRTKRHGEAAFSYYDPSLWNSLPKNLRGAETVDIF